MMDILAIIGVAIGVALIVSGFVVWKFVKFVCKNMYSWHPKYSSDESKDKEDEFGE